MSSIDVAYHEAGDPVGEPLILASSLATTRRIWGPLVDRLGERFRLIMYDHRGHGESPVPPGPYTLDDLGEDVLRLAHRLELDRFSFAGISIGGMVGMWLGINAPEHVERLGLIATFSEVSSPEMWTDRAELVRSEGLAEVVRNSLDRWFTPEFRREHPEVVQEVHDSAVATPAEGYAACCEAIAGLDLTSRLGEIDCPVILIGGDQDASATPELMSKIAERISRAELVMLSAAHLVVVEQPEAVARLLLAQKG